MTPISFVHDGTLYEGFRPYQGEVDTVNIRKLHGPRRYALVIVIASSPGPIAVGNQNSPHTVWTVIDTNIHIEQFNAFLRTHYPTVQYIRYLRSRT